jgi:protein tyrosine phosphatase (PTP) superfamily phosphohydrolase (DUF442 family)
MQCSQLRLLVVGRLSIAALLLMTFTTLAEGADQYPELPRLHQINERLFRGAQPRPGGIRRLAELGINTVINLRGKNALTQADEAEARSLGLNYFNIPLPIWGRPNDSDVQRILEIINAPESGHVFIHCRDGVDRTGMIVALHRLRWEGWTTQMALAEAERSGMRSHQYWMRDYISDFHVRQLRAAINHQPDQGDTNEMNDKIGAGIRVGERVVFRAQKTAVHAARKAPRAVNRLFANFF